MFRMLKKMFTNPWFYRILGFLILAALIILTGHHFAYDDYHPLASMFSRVTLVVILACILFLPAIIRACIRFFRSRGFLDAIKNQFKSEPSTEDGSASIEVMTQGFHKSFQALKSQYTRKEFYNLPWYVLIGSPGIGKTTALMNSGLKFPLEQILGSAVIPSQQGTRHCDWWFTDQAVIMDTAGRYFSQDADGDHDRKEWKALLSLLRRYRKRPVNGVMVALSAEHMLSSDESQRNQHALMVQHRLRELEEELGDQVPVYFMLTKLDLIDGFEEYFAHLDTEDKKQVLGITFDSQRFENGQALVEGFSNELAAMVQRMNQQVVQRVSDERSPEARLKIFNFPQRLALQQNLLVDFMHKIFARTVSQEEATTWLRGVYFTSGIAASSSNDSTIASSQPTDAAVTKMGVPEATGRPETTKSYFVEHLLERLIFAEKDLVKANPKAQRRMRWLSGLGYAAVVAGLSILTLAWFAHYNQQKLWVDESLAELESLNEERLPLTELAFDTRLALLDRLSLLSESAGFTKPRFWEVGLSVSEDIASSIDYRYRQLLQHVLLPPVALDLQQVIENKKYDTLRRYEAMTVYLQLRDEGQFDPRRVQQFMLRDGVAERIVAEAQDDSVGMKSSLLAVQRHLSTMLFQYEGNASLNEDDHEEEGRTAASDIAGDSLSDDAKDNPVVALHADSARSAEVNADGETVAVLDYEFFETALLELDLSELKRARDRLERIPVNEWLYAVLETKLMADPEIHRLPQFTLLTAAGRQGEQVFIRKSSARFNEGIHGLYTLDGYEYFQKQLLTNIQQLLRERAWVLAKADALIKAQDPAIVLEASLLEERLDDARTELPELPPKEIQRQVEQVLVQYENQYCEQYETLLSDVSILPFSTPATASRVLSILSDAETSPLVSLITSVSNETALQRHRALPNVSVEWRGSSSVRPSLEPVSGRQIAHRAMTGLRFAKGDAPEEYCLSNLRALLPEDGEAGQVSEAMQRVLNLMSAEQTFMVKVAFEQSSGGALSPELIQDGHHLALQLGYEAEQPMPLIEGLLSAMSEQVSSVTKVANLAEINQSWAEGPYKFCQASVEGRYPFSRWGSSEISIHEFEEFFGHDGHMDRFFKEHIKPYVDTSYTPWRSRSGFSSSIKLRPEAITAFEKAHEIRTALMSIQKGGLYTEFTMTPLKLDPGIYSSSITIAGQTLLYENDAPTPMTIGWPGEDTNSGVVIKIRVDRQQPPIVKHIRGPWALFKLIKASKIEGASHQQFNLSYKVGSYTLRYKIREVNSSQPLRLTALNQFTCPERL